MREKSVNRSGQSRDYAVLTGGFIPVSLGLLTLAGWLSGQLFLARMLPQYIPMSPDTALLFVIGGTIMVLTARQHPDTAGVRPGLLFLILLCAGYGIIQFFNIFFGFRIDWERILLPSGYTPGSSAGSNISPYTAILFGISYLSRFFYHIGRRPQRFIDLSAICGLLVFIAGFIASVGYIFGTPFLYGGKVIPLAATTAVGFLFLGYGLLAMSRQKNFIIRPFIGSTAGARLLRGILPLVITMLLVNGIVIDKVGLNHALLSAILTLLFVFITSLVALHLARTIFRRADDAEDERRHAEHELYLSRQMLQAILDNIPQRVFCKDRNSVYMWCNKAFAVDAGLDDPLKIIGMDDFEMPWRENAAIYRADDHAVMETGKPKLQYVEPQTFSNGEKGWLQTSKMPLRTPDGNIFGVLGSFENITERKKIEEALLQAKNDAEAASRAKDEFLSTISHELLTPLNGILGFSELIDEIIAPQGIVNAKEIRNDLRTIHECGESLLRVINDVLELSKIQAGNFDSAVTDFSPEKLITTTLGMFNFSADARGLYLKFIPSDLPEILLGDDRRLKQILFNLIGNAVKFTEKGGVEVSAEWNN